VLRRAVPWSCLHWIFYKPRILWIIFKLVEKSSYFFGVCHIGRNNLLYSLFCIINTSNGPSFDFHRSTGSYPTENTKSPFVFAARCESWCFTQSSSVDVSLGFQRAFDFYHTESTNHWRWPVLRKIGGFSSTEGLHVFSVRWPKLELGLLDKPFSVAEIKIIKYPSFLSNVNDSVLYRSIFHDESLWKSGWAETWTD